LLEQIAIKGTTKVLPQINQNIQEWSGPLFKGSFTKNFFHLTLDSAYYRVVGHLEMTMVFWCFFCRSESHTPASQSLLAQLRGKQEATGVKPLLLGRTTICVGARTVQPAQSRIMTL
jgi:hypothetical protein